MVHFDKKPVRLRFPLQSFVAAEEQKMKLPSLFHPKKLSKRHLYKWIYVGLLSEYPSITRQQVRVNFMKYSVDQLAEIVYAPLEVNVKDKGSLEKLSFYMEEVD